MVQRRQRRLRDLPQIRVRRRLRPGGRPGTAARVPAFEAGSNQWRRLDDWPPACLTGCPANLTALYLAPGRTLAFSAPAARASDSYISDPAKPVGYRAAPNLSPWAAGSTWRTW